MFRSHSGSVSRFWPKPAPHLVFCKRVTPPPPPRTCHHPTPTHHPALPFHTVRWNRATAARFRFLGPNPLPASRFANTQHHHHHHLTNTTTPPLRTIPHCRFTRCTRNRATAAWFRVFGPNLLPASCFTNARPHCHHHLVRTPTPPVRTVPHCHFTWHAQNWAPAARFFLFHPSSLHAGWYPPPSPSTPMYPTPNGPIPPNYKPLYVALIKTEPQRLDFSFLLLFLFLSFLCYSMYIHYQ